MPPSEDDWRRMRPSERDPIIGSEHGVITQEDFAAALEYIATSADHQQDKTFELTFRMSSTQMYTLGDDLLWEIIVKTFREFDNARAGARSSDAISHANALKFLVQLLDQQEAHTHRIRQRRLGKSI